MLELFLEGDFTDTFEVTPSIVDHAGAFHVSVKNSRRLDHERIQAAEITVTDSLGRWRWRWR